MGYFLFFSLHSDCGLKSTLMVNSYAVHHTRTHMNLHVVAYRLNVNVT
jgi:hypothetical protein